MPTGRRPPRPPPDALDLQSVCAVDAASGDGFTLVARRSAGNVEAGGGGRGTMELTGATGKYSGIKGTCEYDIDYLEGQWLVLMTDREWRRP